LWGTGGGGEKFNGKGESSSGQSRKPAVYSKQVRQNRWGAVQFILEKWEEGGGKTEKKNGSREGGGGIKEFPFGLGVSEKRKTERK